MNTAITNTTVQNRSKWERLSSAHTIPAHHVKGTRVVDFLQSLRCFQQPKEHILFSIGCFLLKGNNNPAVKGFLNEYDYEIVEIKDIPTIESDLLGSAYQFLNTKIENLEKGLFYTSKYVATDFVYNLDFSAGQVIFDPACGSGSFLFNSNAPAGQIYGVDIDPIAIMIAKFNYFIKFPDAASPKLYCEDFFNWFSTHKELTFDYIIGNPPYGANLDLRKIPSEYVSSGESFSYFIEFCYRLLKEGGVFRFLLPEAILNVKRHTDIRDFILNRTNLQTIKKISMKFSGVMSDVYMLELNRGNTQKVVFINGSSTRVPKNIYRSFNNHVFVHLHEQDILILEKVNGLKQYDLSKSVFGLGVVTGDNRTKIFDKAIAGSEHIYTGKEVAKYKLLPPKNYLIFDRKNLQQVAPDEIYRAPTKLVYKTINKFLKVAIDTTGALTSNSANIIIPQIQELDIYAILALLNSNLYSYLHSRLFGGVNKIAKENLMALPLPRLSAAQNKAIKKLTLDAIEWGVDEHLQNYINQEIFQLTGTEVSYINNIVGNASRYFQSEHRTPVQMDTLW